MRIGLHALLCFVCVLPVCAQQHPLTAKQAQQRDDLQRWVMNNVEMWKPWTPQKFVAVLGPYQKSPSPEKPVWDAYCFPKADATILVARQMNVMMLWRSGRAIQ